ncbi:MAG: hypothetical protein ACK55I_42090, partial [bacterium]
VRKNVFSLSQSSSYKFREENPQGSVVSPFSTCILYTALGQGTSRKTTLFAVAGYSYTPQFRQLKGPISIRLFSLVFIFVYVAD